MAETEDGYNPYSGVNDIMPSTEDVYFNVIATALLGPVITRTHDLKNVPNRNGYVLQCESPKAAFVLGKLLNTLSEPINQYVQTYQSVTESQFAVSISDAEGKLHHFDAEGKSYSGAAPLTDLTQLPPNSVHIHHQILLPVLNEWRDNHGGLVHAISDTLPEKRAELLKAVSTPDGQIDLQQIQTLQSKGLLIDIASGKHADTLLTSRNAIRKDGIC